MLRTETLPSWSREMTQRTILFEAENGQARRDLLLGWLDDAARQGAHCFLLDCDFDKGGLWSGLNDLLWEIITQLRATSPELIEKHSYELAVVFPILRRKMKIRNESLTESSPSDERTRNFSVDRAYRIVQGLIDLLTEWHGLYGKGSLVFACDSFDNSGALVQRFFAELLRRRGRRLEVTVLLATVPGDNRSLALWSTPVEKVSVDLLQDPPAAWPREETAQRADELEEKALADTIDLQIVLPDLIRCLRHLGDHERAVKWQAIAFGVYNHFGFYEDAYRYSQIVQENLDYLTTVKHPFYWDMTRWNLVGNLFGCYIGCNEMEKAFQVVKQEGLEKIDNPVDLPRIYWVLAMLHARYLPEKDLDKADEYLCKGLALVVDNKQLASEQKHFLTTFLENGLALVRFRQGRSQEAIELCQIGFERLQRHLSPDQHRLHRSVLLYNMAQVYTSLGVLDSAIHYYTEAMTMDPAYSEYYNERGNLYLQQGRREEAMMDYQKAIELSSPYQEVWTNLGQALRQLERFAEAVEAYSRAIDLDAGQCLSHIGRAQSYEALGDSAAALVDYSLALEIEPNQPLVLGNRAVLFYEDHRLEECLADLSSALALSPGNAELYENRSVALIDLGRFDEALQDLQSCLQLYLDPADHQRITERLESLRKVA